MAETFQAIRLPCRPADASGLDQMSLLRGHQRVAHDHHPAERSEGRGGSECAVDTVMSAVGAVLSVQQSQRVQ